MKVLLTGFEPFGGHRLNSSWEIVRGLGGRGRRVLCLPVEYRRARELAIAAIDRYRPRAVLMFGQADGAAALRLEHAAHNLEDASLADNAGEVARGRPVVATGPRRYEATLPLSLVLEALRAAGIPAEESWDAGRYVCNSLYYAVLHAVAERYPGLAAGFVHVPLLPEQAEDTGRPSLSRDLLRTALAVVVSRVEAATAPPRRGPAPPRLPGLAPADESR